MTIRSRRNLLLLMLLPVTAAITIYLFLPDYRDFKLTPNEQKWISEHPVIRIAPNKNFSPVEFFDDKGNYKGLAADIINIISERTGLRFVPTDFGGMQGTFDAIGALKVDVVSATSISSERAKYLIFSQPFIKLQKVIVVHLNDKRNLTPDSLNGMRVAVLKNSSFHEDIMKRVPEAKLDLVPSSLDALYEVSLGRSEAAVMNLATAAYLIRDKGMRDLRIAGDYSIKSPYVMAVRKDFPELVQIINKVLASIPQKQLDEITQRWLGLKLEKTWWEEIPWQWILAALTFFGISYVGVLLWNRSLKRQVRRQTSEMQMQLNERLRAERDLRESESRFRHIVKLLPEAIFIAKRNGDIVEVNDAACALLNYSEDELLVRNVKDLVTITEIKRALKVFSRRTDKLEYFKTSLLKKDGSSIPIEGAVIHVYIQQERRYLGVVRDISLRQQAEEKLLESREKLKELNEQKDRFFSIISHDLRSPFLGVIGLSEMLVQSGTELTSAEIRRVNQNLNSALKTQYNLLEDLLKWSQIQIGKFEIEIHEFFIRAVIHKVIEELRKNSEQKEIDIRNHISDDLKFKADSNIISSIFRNLLSNAIKFTRKGGKIQFWSVVKNEKITIIVEDNGIGMNEEQIKNLFQLNLVASSRGTENESGTGLGLILVKEMLEKIDGTINIKSQIDRGTTIEVTLPSRN